MQVRGDLYNEKGGKLFMYVQFQKYRAIQTGRLSTQNVDMGYLESGDIKMKHDSLIIKTMIKGAYDGRISFDDATEIAKATSFRNGPIGEMMARKDASKFFILEMIGNGLITNGDIFEAIPEWGNWYDEQ